MPDLGNLLAPPPAAALLPVAAAAGTPDLGLGGSARKSELLAPSGGGAGAPAAIKKGRRGCKAVANGMALEDHVRAWAEARVKAGVPEGECLLPFLCNAPRMVECQLCRKYIYSGDRVVCSVRHCQCSFHQKCAKYCGGSKFRCPQHLCFVCKQKPNWCCARCTIAVHDKCCPWPDDILYLTGQHRRAICWRHSKNWHLENEYAVPTSDAEEAFQRLPVPYIDEEFSIDALLKEVAISETKPAPYIPIKRNIYRVKKKRDDIDVDGGCSNCNYRSLCGNDCECRSQLVSCSKTCRCSSLCTNRPFRKEKRIKIVKTKHCGWGVEALEPIAKGDFIIEYIGEVIDDAECEQRLWGMKFRGDKNFYMCEIRKDFTIDATFKGNASRFLNHSCSPNCKLEKWQVEGETRVGVFASRAIGTGEPLTYDYRFEHFGPMVRCHCGAPKCQGYLGSKKKIITVLKAPLTNVKSLACWGCKRKRTSIDPHDSVL